MPEYTTNWKSNVMLLLTAAIWGFAFTAQRVGMDYVDPFTFNMVRFFLGGSVLVPVILLTGLGEVMKEEGDIPEAVDVILSKPVSLKDLRKAIFDLTGQAPD